MKTNLEHYSTIKERLQGLRKDYVEALSIAEKIIDEKRKPYFAYIYTLHKDGYTQREIAKMINISYNSIFLTIKKMKGGEKNA